MEVYIGDMIVKYENPYQNPLDLAGDFWRFEKV